MKEAKGAWISRRRRNVEIGGSDPLHRHGSSAAAPPGADGPHALRAEVPGGVSSPAACFSGVAEERHGGVGDDRRRPGGDAGAETEAWEAGTRRVILQGELHCAVL